MKKKPIIFLLFIIFLVFFSDNAVGHRQVCFQNKCFYVEIVEHPEDLQKGLMFREHLDKTQGMLFIFLNSDLHAFWMKNTLIPLDIIWLDESRKIVSIAHQALPCLKDPCFVYYPQKSAKYVLEINGGLCQKLKIRVGDKAKFLFE
ncbi:MAG TPA: DUF192 domain-containing protein [Candidatus Omnitrophota bacterium]|nr:DUF192 domain-containing protein [Candidatus Omnitrophota bacterium]HPN89051.1 DUF192 domain-containing protein [Candidatus Omnitrophota bacterium]